MMFLNLPHLPLKPVNTVIIGEGHHFIRTALNQKGIKTIEICKSNMLDAPVQNHIDLQVMHLGYNEFYTCSTQAKDYLEGLGAMVYIGELPSIPYPQDCLYNNLILGKYIIVGKKTNLPSFISEKFKILRVSQSYVKCSVAVVSENAVITSDIGISKALREVGISVLIISAGHFKLDGYDYGFVGGSCMLVSNDELLFFGDISLHPDYQNIIDFCSSNNVKVSSLIEDYPVTDIGSAIILN